MIWQVVKDKVFFFRIYLKKKFIENRMYYWKNVFDKNANGLKDFRFNINCKEEYSKNIYLQFRYSGPFYYNQIKSIKKLNYWIKEYAKVDSLTSYLMYFT